MTISNLLTPWILLAVVLAPLVYVEKWIHSHLYGVGWLLTKHKKSATALYYLILFPGVFLHEFTQWLVAGALGVRTKRVMAWPQAQDDGTLRLDFVQIPDETDWLRAAIVGAAPVIVGTAAILFISNRILNLETFITALSTGDITEIGSAIQTLGSTPDFYLWLYVIFAISNAMLPTPADRKGWPLVIGLFGAVLLFLVVIGVGDVLLETFTGPVAHALNLLTAALVTVLLIELLAIPIIGLIEEILERATKDKFNYSKPKPKQEARQPGSSRPLPPGEPLPSIYNMDLPVPSPSELDRLVARAKARTASAAARTAPAPERSIQPERGSATSPERGPAWASRTRSRPGSSEQRDETARDEPTSPGRVVLGTERPSNPSAAPPQRQSPSLASRSPSRREPPDRTRRDADTGDESEATPPTRRLLPGAERSSRPGMTPPQRQSPSLASRSPSLREPPDRSRRDDDTGDESETAPPTRRFLPGADRSSRPGMTPPQRQSPSLASRLPSRREPPESDTGDSEENTPGSLRRSAFGPTWTPESFRQRGTPGSKRPSSPFFDDEDEEDEDGEDITYIDFDDI